MTIHDRHSRSLSAIALLVLCFALGLSACGGGSQSEPAPQTGGTAAFNWTHEAVRAQGRPRPGAGTDMARTCCRARA